MRWRTTAALTALIGLLAAVTACGTPNGQDAAVTVYYPSASVYADVLKTAVQPLENQAGGPHVKLALAGKDYNELNQRISREAATGRLPDAALIGLNNLRGLADLGIAQPLDPAIADGRLNTKDIDPKILELTQYNGKQYGIPYGVSTPILYANEAMFKAAGLDPTHLPTTWTQLREVATRLADPANHKYGIVMDWTGGSNLDFQMQLTSAGGALLTPDGSSATFNSPQGEAVLDYWGRFVKDGAMPLLARTDVTSPNVQAFVNGDAAMLIQSSGNIGAINANAKFPVLAGQVPIADGGTRTQPAAGSTIVLLTKDPQRQAAALKVIQQLVSPIASTALTLARGYLPVNSTARKSPELQKYFSEQQNQQPALAAVPYLRQWQTYPGGHDVEVNDALQNSIVQALSGSKSPKQALAEAQDTVNKILGTK